MAQWWKMVEGEWADLLEGWPLGRFQGLRATPTGDLNRDGEAEAAAPPCGVGCPGSGPPAALTWIPLLVAVLAPKVKDFQAQP